jgi:Nif-specific regulatory protein
MPRDPEYFRSDRLLDALAEVARVLEGMPLGRGALDQLVPILEAATRTTVHLVLHEEDGSILEVEGYHHESCLEQGVCTAQKDGVCPVASQKASNLTVVFDEGDSNCHRRRFLTMADNSPTGRICVPIVVAGNVIGSLSAMTLESDPEEIHEIERFLAIVTAMLAADASHRASLARERAKFAEENLRLRDALGEQLRPERMVGSSRPMRDLYARIAQVADSETTVLIRGESGTGKELVASAIHYGSSRAKKPFVRVNVAALGENLLESELFGHEKGAFTGAQTSRIGRIEEAQGGTLFLDEIGDFSPVAQVKLLRVLQEREFERVGSNKTIRADVRIVAATNRDLEKAVTEGTFRHDLYYRINVFPVHLPALRTRTGDILQLADHFAAIFGRRMNKTITRISTPAIDALLAYHWPGNVRELENVIEHAVLLATDGVIFEHNLPPSLQLPHTTQKPVSSLAQRVEALERDMIQDALKRTDGNVAAAARELGLTARVTRYKIKALRLHVPEMELEPSPKSTKSARKSNSDGAS